MAGTGAGMEGQDENTEGNSMKFEGVPKRFSYGELSAATGHFSNDSKLGQGGFGSVYRGRLQSGTLVAVKRMNSSMQGQGRREFEHEVAILIKVRHRNLIELRGWCEDRDRSECLLVYELAPNGSLDDAMFKVGLSWPQRLSILTGTAAALDYLHQGWKRQVLHRDVKCSNIMLDEDWNAKLGDFGISRMVDHECDAATMTMVGTFGYMAPELFAVGRFTEKSDVYAFGVVVLEVLCGRRVLPKKGSHELGLVPFVRDVSKKKRDLLSVVDKQLTGYDKHQMVAVLEVGVKCTSEDPNNRPSMRKVVHMLEMDPSSGPVVAKTKPSWKDWFRSQPKREWHSSPGECENVASSSSVWVKHDPIPHPIADPITVSENVASSSSVWVKHDPIPHPIADPITVSENVASSSSVWVKHDPIPHPIADPIPDKIVERVSKKDLVWTDGKCTLRNKIVDYLSVDNIEQSLTVVNILKRAHHINLVSLVAYCDVGKAFLIYEHPANGYLEQWIYGKKYRNEWYTRERRGTLDWRRRLQIALDVAQGLQYLHKIGVVHRSVNSRYIALDQSMVAKVGSLGWLQPNMKLLPNVWVGSLGVYDPGPLSYGQNGTKTIYSFKSDVYQFGLVLTAIITDVPVFYKQIDGCLHQMLRANIDRTPHYLMKFVDPGLQYDIRSMWKMAELVLQCVKPIISDRPDMDEVVGSIEKALELAKI